MPDYVVGRSSVLWWEVPEYLGAIHWGAFDERTVRELISLLEHADHPWLTSTSRVVVDCRYVDGVDGDVLHRLTLPPARVCPPHPARDARHAIVLPAGISGLMVAGALALLAPLQPHRCFHHIDDALAFLDDAAMPPAHAAAAALAAEAGRRPPLLGELRERLNQDLAEASIESIAAALALSVRTLQRRLRDHETSFSDELRLARVAAASELLRHSDAKVDSIASRIGAGTASRLSAMLRRELHVTATALRAQNRAA